MSIGTKVELQDGITSPLLNIANALTMVIDSFETLNVVSTGVIDTSNLENAYDMANQAAAAIMQLNETQPTTTNPVNNDSAPLNQPTNKPVETPIEWVTPSNIDVFAGNGMERYEQEVSSLNAMLDDVIQNQQNIANQAKATDIFPNNMINDIQNMNNRINNLKNTIEQLSNAQMDDIGADKVNNDIETLRGQLNDAIKLQEQLSAAMGDMDVGTANQAYNQLNNTMHNLILCPRHSVR